MVYRFLVCLLVSPRPHLSCAQARAGTREQHASLGLTSALIRPQKYHRALVTRSQGVQTNSPP